MVELRRGKKLVARSPRVTVTGTAAEEVVLRRAGRKPLAAGRCTLRVRSGGTQLVRKAVRLRGR